MITRGIREIKGNLSKYIHMVKEGEEVIITERGTPVAVIKALSEEKNMDKRLLKAAERNLIELPKRSGLKPHRRLKTAGRLSEIVLEEREAADKRLLNAAMAEGLVCNG
ncbi:MAG: type II toxin-antitoxin system Phd/YefM family antitoxin [Thermodesulfovibrionales bacterium]